MKEKLKVTKWMIIPNTEDTRFLFRRTLDQFPECFRTASSSAHFMKVSRWWANRDAFAAACESSTHRQSVQAVQPGIRKKVLLKALPGRGRKRAERTDWLQHELHDEFHRLQKAGLKV